MTPRKQKNGRVVPSPESLRVANPHAAGIDVHASVHWVAVPSDHMPASESADANAAANLPPHVRKFGACTADLELLADWPHQCGITSVAPASRAAPRPPQVPGRSAGTPQSREGLTGHAARAARQHQGTRDE